MRAINNLLDDIDAVDPVSVSPDGGRCHCHRHFEGCAEMCEPGDKRCYGCNDDC